MPNKVSEIGDGILESKYHSENAIMLPLDMLEPFAKVQSEDFYSSVINSMEKEGLLYPLIIAQVDEDEWWEDCKEQGEACLQPRVFGSQVRYRVQCGNNRYWALINHFTNIDAVSCLVYSKEEAMEICKMLRRDKNWKRT
jgi:hypothetical protein